jgi:tetratricopeptide (TPR) repeat protein
MKKSTDSWYKNRTWNGDIDTRFEKQLRYTRNPIHKAEYLLTQGSLLLENPNQNIQEVGQVLLSRLIDDLTTEHSPILTAQEKLGDYFYKKKEYEKAAGYYKIVVDYCVEQQSRTNTSMMTDLKWAECMLHMNQVDQFEKAYELLANYPVTLLKTPEQKFYHAELGALLCERMYKKTEAVEYAQAAIKLSSKLKPVAPGKNKNAEVAMQIRLAKLAGIAGEGVNE